MEQHILSILKESNTIIIPNLGALTITNQTTGEIMFMPYLKYDDGKLSSYIAEQEGISTEEAKGKITNFTENILNTLATSGTINVAGIGTFYKGVDDIEFSHNSEQEGNKIESVVAENTIIEENPTESEVVEEVTVQETIAEINSESSNEEQAISDLDSTKQEVVQEDVPATSKEDIKAAIKAEKEAKAKADKEAKEKAKAEKEAKIKAEKEAKAKAKADKKNGIKTEEGEQGKTKKKKGLLFWVILIVIIALIGDGIYLGLNILNNKQTHEKNTEENLTSNEKMDENHPKENNDTKNDENSSSKVENEQLTNNNEATSTSVSGTFYIIVGTFSEKVNAEGLAERLRMEGVNSANVIDREGKHSVVFNQYNSKDEALNDLENAKMKAKHAWIYSAK